MKKIGKEEFYAIKKKNRTLSLQGAKADELIKEFIESGYDIVEIEHSDFNGFYDFDNVNQRRQAYCAIRNRLQTKGHEGVILESRSCKIFLRRANA